MFIWSVKSIMDEFDEHQPELAEGLSFLKEKVDTPQMDEAVYDVYSKTKSISESSWGWIVESSTGSLAEETSTI